MTLALHLNRLASPLLDVLDLGAIGVSNNKTVGILCDIGPREAVGYNGPVLLRGSLLVEWLDWMRKSKEVGIPSRLDMT